jgi:hypothetical protein
MTGSKETWTCIRGSVIVSVESSLLKLNNLIDMKLIEEPQGLRFFLDGFCKLFLSADFWQMHQIHMLDQLP